MSVPGEREGRTLLLCFHGYGESAASFSFLGEAIGMDYTVLAIDLPYHGETEWKGGRYFHPEELVTLIDRIVADLPELDYGWWLMGYSMGGRVALSLVEEVPERIAGMLLIAPDGLVTNPWYWLATQTGPGNRLFRRTMRNPGWFFFFLRLGHFFRLVNPSVVKFTRRYIDNDLVREQLYTRWTFMRAFRPDIAHVQALLLARKTAVRLIYGRFDRIIRWERGERFCEKLQPYSELILLPTGHQLLQPRWLDVFLSVLTPRPKP